jgi:hypothetical protein
LQDELVAADDDVDDVLAENRQELLLEVRDCGDRTNVGEVVGEVELEISPGSPFIPMRRG